LCFLDDDDEYLPSFLDSTNARLVNANANVGMSWCGVRSRDDRPNGAPETTREFPLEYSTKIALFQQLLSIGIGFGTAVRAACLSDIGGFDVGLAAVEDTDWFLRMLSANWLPVVTPGVHVLIHGHDHGRVTGMSMHGVRIDECNRLLERHSSFFRQFPSAKNQLLRHLYVLRRQLSANAQLV